MLSDVALLAPIPRPKQDVICLGINYKAHADEAERYSDAFKKERPIPIYFSKRVTEAVAPNGFIESHPGLVERLDYEAELAVIKTVVFRKGIGWIYPYGTVHYICG